MSIRQPGLTRVGFRRMGGQPTGGGVFPGFGGAPPAIASASSAGGSGLASQSNHTHAFDFPAYNPSLAAMQATGVVQQSYAAPTATPAVLTMVQYQVPFGSATGTLTQTGNFFCRDNGTQTRIGVQPQGSSMTPANIGFNGIQVLAEGTNNSTIANTSCSTSLIAGYTMARYRGTWAAPTAALAGDMLGQVKYSAGTGVGVSVSNATLLNSVLIGFTGTTALGAWGVQQFNTTFSTLMYDFMATNDGDVALGLQLAGGKAPTDVSGFVYFPWANSPPTGVPVPPTQPAAWSGVPAIFTKTDTARWYAYQGGWHFVQLNDYEPTATRVPFGGATAGTSVDSDTLTFAVTATHGKLTVGSTAVAHDGTVLVNSGVNGQSIGGGATAGVYVADPNAAGAASVAADDYFFGQGLVGYSSLTLGSLFLGVGGANNVLSFRWAADRVGGGTSVFNLDSNNGNMTFGDVIGAKPVMQVQPTAGANAGDLMLGYTAIAVGDTHGFPYMPYVNFRPTGAPNVFAGAGAAFVYDGLNRNLVIRNPVGGLWETFPPFSQSVAAGAGIQVTTNIPAGYNTTPKYWFFKDSAGTNTIVQFFQP